MTIPTQNGTNGTSASSALDGAAVPKKRILLNAFDMSTVGHLSPGQWKNPKDRSATKRKLEYWIELAKLLERGGINALFLADTYGGYDTYEGSLDNCIRRAAQWPMTDPTIVSALPNLDWMYERAANDNAAHLRNGSSDKEPCLRCYSIDIF